MTGTEDAQPARDVAEALAYFRNRPEDIDAIQYGERPGFFAGAHAATIVRAALAAGSDDVVHDAVWSLEMLVARYQDREESAVIDPMQGKAFGVVASQLAPVVERLSTALAGARPAAGPDEFGTPGDGNGVRLAQEYMERRASARPAGDATTDEEEQR